MGLLDGLFSEEQKERAVSSAEHIRDLLHQQVEALEDMRERDEQTWRANGATAPGGVVVDVPLETNYFDPGNDWTITRFTAKGPPSGSVEVYLDTPGDPMQLVEVFALNANGSYGDAVSNNLYVLGGRQVIARFLGPPALGTLCVIRAQIKRTSMPAQRHAPVEAEYPPQGHREGGADPALHGDPMAGRQQAPQPGGEPPSGLPLPDEPDVALADQIQRGLVDERLA